MIRKDQPFSVFGRYMNLLYLLLNTHQAEIARLTKLDASTISKAMRPTKYRVEEDTVAQIWQAFMMLAERRGMERLLDTSMREGFFNAAHCTTEDQVSLSEQRLESLMAVLEAKQERRSSSGQN